MIGLESAAYDAQVLRQALRQRYDIAVGTDELYPVAIVVDVHDGASRTWQDRRSRRFPDDLDDVQQAYPPPLAHLVIPFR
jgi:hypothetical protein